MNGVAVRSESIFESQRGELLDTTQREDGVGVVVSYPCCYGLSLCSAVGILGVVYVDRLAP
eukprot:4879585-Pleurochrysis_carterae.AAC.1